MNILANRRNRGEYVLEAVEWVGISYREIWSGWSIELFFTTQHRNINLFYKYVSAHRMVKKPYKYNMNIFPSEK